MKRKYLSIKIIMAAVMTLGCAWNVNIFSAAAKTVNNSIYSWKDTKTKKWGAVNNKGAIVLKTQYDSINIQDGCAVVTVGEKEGLINNSGKYILNAQYDHDSIGSINSNKIKLGDLIKLSVNQKVGIANTNGTIIVKPQYYSIGNLSEGMIPFSTKLANGSVKYGYMNTAGKILCQPKFDNASSFSAGFAVVTNSNKNYIINNKFITTKQISNFYDRTYAYGIYVICNKPNSEDTLYGLMNTKGDVVLKPEYRVIGTVAAGLAAFETNEGNWGYINDKGSIAIKPAFTEAADFSEGLAAVKVKNNNKSQWGFIDGKGKTIIKPQFSQVSFDGFKDGLCPVRVKVGAWAYINKTGKVVFNVQCSNADSFNGDLAQISTGNETSVTRHYINKQGKTVK